MRKVASEHEEFESGKGTKSTKKAKLQKAENGKRKEKSQNKREEDDTKPSYAATQLHSYTATGTAIPYSRHQRRLANESEKEKYLRSR